MSSGRKLPSWMLTSAPTIEGKSSFTKENVNIGVPYLKYPGKIVYCYNKDECNFICEEINIHSVDCGSVFGFDIEWKVSYQKSDYRLTALLQLCNEHTCYLFHLAVMNGFPSELKILLESNNIVKVGVGIKGDIDRMVVDYNVKINNGIDLSTLANEMLTVNEKWSLNGLLMNQLHLQISKDKIVRCSDWEVYPLSCDQQKYAALDAYAGLLIYQKLCETA